MKIKVLGICGSPIKKGNTEVFLEEALKSAKEIEGVETQLLTLAHMDIHDCLHCNWCIRSQKEGQFCSQKDDMSEIYPLILETDALLLASPVYLGRLSGYLACFIDRLRLFMHGNYYAFKLRDKVGGALAVSWFRSGGGELTLLTINRAFSSLGMFPIQGTIGFSTLNGLGKFDPEDKHLILKNERELESARRLAKRVVEIATIMKAGKKALAGG